MKALPIKHRMPTRNLGTIVHKNSQKRIPKMDRKYNKRLLACEYR